MKNKKNNLIKVICIIFVNLIAVILLFFIADYSVSKIAYNHDVKELINNKIIQDSNSIEKFKYKIGMHHFRNLWKLNDWQYGSLERDYVTDSQKKSVIIFGCSFAFGAWLERDKNFSAILSKLTNRTVYNRAYSACGFGHMLWQTQQELFYKSINIPPEYAIYIYIPDHLIRSCHYKYGISLLNDDNFYLSYEIKNGKLVEKVNPFFLNLSRLNIIKNYNYKVFCSSLYYAKDKDKNIEFIKLHFIQARNELKKRYPNIKFIILKYPFNYYEGNDYSNDIYEKANMESYKDTRWSDLEKEGFIIIELNKDIIGFDVNDKEYQLPDGHPNTKAWEIIAPKVVELTGL